MLLSKEELASPTQVFVYFLEKVMSDEDEQMVQKITNVIEKSIDGIPLDMQSYDYEAGHAGALLAYPSIEFDKTLTKPWDPYWSDQ